jgi:hypothetical protein
MVGVRELSHQATIHGLTVLCCTYVVLYLCTIPTTYLQHLPHLPAPTRHFVVLRRVWFLIIKYICFETYSLLAPKCRVGADRPGFYAPTRHFVVLRRVWFTIIKYLSLKAYPLLAPKCRVGAEKQNRCDW